MIDSQKTKRGFMCLTDFNYQVEEGIRSVAVFPTVEALTCNKHCASECGIIEVEIKIVNVITSGDTDIEPAGV